ncbi:MAG: site-specific integrase [Oscillospiraceae bacterium]|nr:site-specific integrase [Oscillospiraceae bacterium]MBR3849550.1 site-specific integrase [Oscillospiraceae bacterium]
MQLRLGGESISITAPTERECARQAALVKAEHLNGKRTAKANTTLSQAIDAYIARRSKLLSPATIRGYRIIQKHRFQELMNRKVSSIDTNAVQAVINAEAEKYSVKTLRNTTALILPALADAGQHINEDSLLYPMRIEKEKTIYTEEQQQALLVGIHGTDIEIPVLLASWLGLRRSEIIALRWRDVDLCKKVLSVHSARVQDEHNQYVNKDVTKTPRSTRKLTLSPYLCAVLSAAMPEDNPDAFIVPTSPQTIRNHMVKICERIGIPFLGLHALRHTNASVMLKLGIENQYAQARGGWSTDATLKRRYQHLFPGDQEIADAAVNAYYESIVASPTPKKQKKFRIVRHFTK